MAVLEETGERFGGGARLEEREKMTLGRMEGIQYRYSPGGFLLACEGSGGMFDHSFSAWAFFFFFFKVEINSRTLIPLFMPGSVHSGSAS